MATYLPFFLHCRLQFICVYTQKDSDCTRGNILCVHTERFCMSIKVYPQKITLSVYDRATVVKLAKCWMRQRICLVAGGRDVVL